MGYLGAESGQLVPRSSCKLSAGMNRQIFFDPERKRWKRLRRILDAVAVLSTLVVVGFVFNVVRTEELPGLLLPPPRHIFRALPDRSFLPRNTKPPRPARRKS